MDIFIKTLNRLSLLFIIVLCVVIFVFNEDDPISTIKKRVNSDRGPSSETEHSDTYGAFIYGSYSDFSAWYGFIHISGRFTVNESTWSGRINDGNTVVRYSGKTQGSNLYDDNGLHRLGYISQGKLYIYYLNNYYPVGR